MEITYIGHSGFFIEWDTCYMLFDYYRGEVPPLDGNKKLFVFVSHVHQDHFNPEIFRLFGAYPFVEFILSSDIKLSQNRLLSFGVDDALQSKIITVKPSSEYQLFDLQKQGIVLKTLRSTDSGVAFLLKYQEKTVYHAGDLNLWLWKEETKQANNNMAALFQKEMLKLKDVMIDLAFAPLDSRQEEYYYMGLESLLNTARVRYVLPMHFWDDPSVIQRFKKERTLPDCTEIFDVLEEGQSWSI